MVLGENPSAALSKERYYLIVLLGCKGRQTDPHGRSAAGQCVSWLLG